MPEEGADRALVENYKYILEYIKDKSDKEVEQLFASYILCRCEFVVTSTSSERMAIQMFRVPSARGKEPGPPGDIFKSRVRAEEEADTVTYCSPCTAHLPQPPQLAARRCRRRLAAPLL